jgi:ribonuclease BN (tRNA processing enzyme)
MSIEVTLLGTGVGIPQPGRSQSAILVKIEGRSERMDAIQTSLKLQPTVVIRD